MSVKRKQRNHDRPRIRQNIYGNWYGYRGTTKVEWFFGQCGGQQEASEWLSDQIKADKADKIRQ